MEIEFTDLGVRGYTEVWKMQQEIQDRIKADKKEGRKTSSRLLFVEHDPVYTLGKSGKEANMLINRVQLQARQAEFIKVDRGGDITFHGPGQLVVYPIVDMEAFGLGVKAYVDDLEDVVIRSLRRYGIEGVRLEGATGVWIEPDTPGVRKICAIGVKCSGYVTMHGFALNVNTDLEYFNSINPCGFVDKGVTSMARELGRGVDWEEVKEVVLEEFMQVFRIERVNKV